LYTKNNFNDFLEKMNNKMLKNTIKSRKNFIPRFWEYIKNLIFLDKNIKNKYNLQKICLVFVKKYV